VRFKGKSREIVTELFRGAVGTQWAIVQNLWQGFCTVNQRLFNSAHIQTKESCLWAICGEFKDYRKGVRVKIVPQWRIAVLAGKLTGDPVLVANLASVDLGFRGNGCEVGQFAHGT
jgi:hypothetical protein